MARGFRVCCIIALVTLAWCAAAPAVDNSGKVFTDRQRSWLERLSERDLPKEPAPGTWVDSERWCVAHACLATGVRLEEANAYLAAVEPVSLWRGLVADTDVQVTDLLRTYLEFRKTDKLTPEAKAHLETFFREWKVPNPDRNRRADAEYEWPSEYTENHSLNILTAAFLIDVVLDRDSTHHKKLLQQFLLDRARYGWSEFHSPSYMLVTAKALSCLFDLSPDQSLSQTARMHLDILMMEYSLQCLKEWRGVPFVRGYGSQKDNSQNSAVNIVTLWWGGEEADAPQDINPFTTHLLTGLYYPPEPATKMATRNDIRGTYVMRVLGTTGPGRQRVPMVVYVTPGATMASAQGYGTYYDGCYWTISFASAPSDVVTGTYDGWRNILQVENVMAVFGTADWFGTMNCQTDGNMSFCENGSTYLGQVDVGEACHVFMLGSKGVYPALDDFKKGLAGLNVSWDAGTVAWKMPDGSSVRMLNTRDGKRWRFERATINNRDVQLEHDMLYDAPFMRSVRESAIIKFTADSDVWVYDLRNPDQPLMRTERGGGFPALPPDEAKGPVGMTMLRVPSGEFFRGSPPSEGRSNEGPQRRVYVPDFYISRTEITIGQYKKYLEANGDVALPPEWYWREWGQTEDHAITWISWDEATRFCEWLSKTTRKAYRLPTEMEWEKAARGFSYRVYPWGDSYDGSQAGTPNGTYAPVATHPADVSPFGVMDMAGGVWEWCADSWDLGTTGGTNAPAQGRALRSCGWNFDPDTFRCSYRSGAASDTRSVHIGFRVVCDCP